MESLIIEGSETLPYVELQTNGNIKIEGRALLEDAYQFFQPILNWVKDYNGEKLILNINLEYFNTSVSKQLHDFFTLLNSKPKSIKISITWHYEEGDDEMKESGEIYKDLFPRFDFIFNEFEEVVG